MRHEPWVGRRDKVSGVSKAFIAGCWICKMWAIADMVFSIQSICAMVTRQAASLGQALRHSRQDRCYTWNWSRCWSQGGEWLPSKIFSVVSKLIGPPASSVAILRSCLDVHFWYQLRHLNHEKSDQANRDLPNKDEYFCIRRRGHLSLFYILHALTSSCLLEWSQSELKSLSRLLSWKYACVSSKSSTISDRIIDLQVARLSTTGGQSKLRMRMLRSSLLG